MPPRLPEATPHNKPKLLDQVRDVIRRKHFSIRTEQSYVDWIRSGIRECLRKLIVELENINLPFILGFKKT